MVKTYPWSNFPSIHVYSKVSILDPSFLTIQFLNGLQLSALLFLLSIGLSVVFGLMNFINLAHGTLYMLGAYLGLTVVRLFDSYWMALLLAPLLVALLGALFYVLLLKRLQRESPMKQVLVTFGLIFVGFDAVRMIWGALPQTISVPNILSGSIDVFGEIYPIFRLFIIAVGFAAFILLYLGLEKTRIGAIIRAGVDDPVMVSALGINVELAFFAVFCLGCYLAGFAGVVAAPVFSLFPGMEMSVLILTMIVVVVGGPGSLWGAALGSLLIGMADTFGQVLFSEFASVTIYALMAIVLLLRPHGLIPARTMR
uniref:Amino acid/amide ABC transporter membrane protein 1, HAAT family n=1 Tax=Candidatus Kentrum sp. FW TaxID=2126338 RepID=A0A450S442_9GAMM|nr:MAG: amino acid/amide ABC transporter membrane protein 1, HAAT family [Candidatus Kentron sp. FW]VFJ70859.1 MAG: amino acid/amide ABC transporter membrane protein 1, HAAT family [Candidatus Kentron sp. FW]